MMKISTRSIATVRMAILVCLLQILAGFSEVYAQCWNASWSSGAAQYHGALTSCSNTTIRSSNLASTCYNQWDCVYGTNYTFTASGGFVSGSTVWTYFEFTGSVWQPRLSGTGGTANITSTINSPSGGGWGLIVFYYNSSCPPTWHSGSATLQYRVNSQASPTINNSSNITVCAGSAASYSVSGNCNYPLTRTAGPASGAAAALGTTTVTHATQYARGDGGYFWWNPGATNQQIALAACEATYGAGNCSAGSCGNFTYYYRTAAGSCDCAKAIGELEFIYSNTGYTTIGQDYGGGPASVPTISAGATSGAGPFVRRKGWADCSQPSTWQLVQPNLRSYGGTTASFTITGLPAASAGTVTAGTTPQCIGGSTTYTVSGVELGGGSGAWSSSNGSVATVNPSTGLVTAVGAGTCNIVYTVTGGCGGTKTASKPYTVTPTANAGTVTAGTSPQCIGGTTTYTVSGVVLGGGIGAWSSSNGSVATVNPSTGLVTAVGAGTCNIVYTVTGGCGGTKTSSASYTVTPDRTVGTASSSPTVCINTSMTSVTHTTTGVTGIGSSAGLPAGVAASYASNTITISGTPTASGTFNYTITPTGCGSATATGTITVNAAPVAYIIPRGGDSVGCTNDEFVLETSVSGGGGGSPSYQWYEYDFGTSSYTLISGATNDTFKTAPLTNPSGSLNKIYRYKVEYNVSGSGCTTGMDEVDITILPTPSLTSTMEDCAGTASGGEWDYVYTTATLGSGPYSVADSTGGSVVVFASPGDVLKIFRVPMGTGSHNFAVTDANGCMAVSTLSANASLPNTLPNTGSAGNAAGQCILKGFNEWVHIRKQFSASEVIASVKDNGVDLGTVTVESYREATSPTVPNSGAVCVGTPAAAMRRHFVVKSGSYSDPSVKFQDGGGNPTDVSLRLYFSQDDFDTLVANTAANNVSGNRCTEDDDITSMNALYLTKYSDYALLGNEDGDYLNNSTNSAYYRVFNVGNITNPMLIKQNGFDTIFGTTGSTFHYAELNVSEFSELW
ncbi:MAG: Ig-like domain-containing protein, partial [Chitinophagales bacterium]|nr:Ig-like domain-containing protein [Chitinophagales bacterium]